MFIPLTVPESSKKRYIENMENIFKNNRTILFAYDHRLEHLQYDFYGNNIDKNAPFVEHAFKIASENPITAFSTHLGLIARYAQQFKNIPYVVKLTAKTSVYAKATPDRPYNYPLWTVPDVVEFEKNNPEIKIRGISLTIYLGSELELEMLQFAAKTLLEAHAHGFIVFFFMYLRGATIENPEDSMLLAGAAGVANSLGADFVKMHPPKEINGFELIKNAAGNTKIIYSGGEHVSREILLERIKDQITLGKSNGVAIGRNIFQRSAEDAKQLIKEMVNLF